MASDTADRVPTVRPRRSDDLLTLGWTDHEARWEACRRCPLGSACLTTVLGRGPLPAAVLVLGNAPGEVEDKTGLPFHGQEGRLLGSLLREALPADVSSSVFFSNALACRPVDADGLTRTPTVEELTSCRPRVMELLALVRPRLVVFAGQVAESFLAGSLDVPSVSIPAPTRMSRAGGYGSSLYGHAIGSVQHAWYKVTR